MKNTLRLVMYLALAGTLFAGYLTYTRLLTGSCALGQTCPIVWGYPACLYGFVLFLSMLIVTALALTGSVRNPLAQQIIVAISSIGILYSGWLIVGEIANGTLIGGSLGVSSCVYGFAMYAAIWYLLRSESKR